MKHLLLVASFLCFVMDIHAQPTDALLVGFGETNVTPDVAKKPVYLAGFGKNRKAT